MRSSFVRSGETSPATVQLGARLSACAELHSLASRTAQGDRRVRFDFAQKKKELNIR